MSITAPSPHPLTLLAALAGPFPGGTDPVDLPEIEAWVDEVTPVLAALRTQAGWPSIGQRRWLADQVAIGAEALMHLECAASDAEAQGEPAPWLEWAHVRVCAAIEGAQAVLDRRAAA